MRGSMKYSDAGAVLSSCQRYRYRLWRQWDDPLFAASSIARKTAAFIMLNPSTADGREDDPTILSCVGFAKAWGCTRLEVVNLFAWRETSPEKMAVVPEPVGPDADSHIANVVQSAHLVVAAWGRGIWTLRPGLKARVSQVLELATSFADVHALKWNKDGSPVHPLYQPHSLKPQVWKPRKVPGELVVEREQS